MPLRVQRNATSARIIAVQRRAGLQREGGKDECPDQRGQRDGYKD